MKKSIAMPGILLFIVISINAEVNIYESDGWWESAYVIWEPVAGSDSYQVYCSGEGLTDKRIDTRLIRNYRGCFRADAAGLKEGAYVLKVVPVIGNDEQLNEATATPSLEVRTHVKTGFAFSDGSVPGAYRADGTLKDGARVLYVDNATAQNVTLDIITDGNGATETVSGIGAILQKKGTGYDRTPLSIRFIGKVSKEHVDHIKDSESSPRTAININNTTGVGFFALQEWQ